jgi:hypothetical protein
LFLIPKTRKQSSKKRLDIGVERPSKLPSKCANADATIDDWDESPNFETKKIPKEKEMMKEEHLPSANHSFQKTSSAAK